MSTSEINDSVLQEIPAVVLGAAGYVGGELLRILAGHPRLSLACAVSRSFGGQSIQSVHPHLSGPLAAKSFGSFESLNSILGDLDSAGSSSDLVAIFSALPHGDSAAVLAELLGRWPQLNLVVVDLAADFRLPTPEDFESLYDCAHGAPQLASQFHCGLPDLESETPSQHLSHPGCFTTATVLTAAPLVASGLFETRIVVNALTGSTGSGHRASSTTHHPTRHATIRAYRPMIHRHQTEMVDLLQRTQSSSTAADLELVFVPHSAPISRGIHVTVSARAKKDLAPAVAQNLYRSFYETAEFVDVLDGAPSLKNVVATNRCQIGVFSEGRELVATGVIDNLTKGSAGGAIHWMNRRLGFPETDGLQLSNPGWI